MTPPAAEQSVDGVLDALLAACYEIFGATLDPTLGEYFATWNDGTTDRTLIVVEAIPGLYQPDVIVAVGTNVAQPVERPTMGTVRSREITVTVDVVFSAALAGGGPAGTEARHVASAAANAFAEYFRTSPNETLGDACRDAWVSALKGPDVTIMPGDDGGVWGRAADITATVTAKVRVRG